MTATAENFKLVHARLDQMDKRFDENMRQVNGRLDNGFGMNYELKVFKNTSTILNQQLDITRVRVLQGAITGPTTPWQNTIDDAVDQGCIDRGSAAQVFAADIVISGQHPEFGPETYVVIEASITVANDDIDRAAERARIISAATFRTAVPAVIGANIDDERAAYARQLGVAATTLPA